MFVAEELNEEIAYRIGRAFAQHLQTKQVVAGGDICLKSAVLKQALTKEIMASCVDVIDTGMISTEEIYFASL